MLNPFVDDFRVRPDISYEPTVIHLHRGKAEPRSTICPDYPNTVQKEPCLAQSRQCAYLDMLHVLPH